MNKIHIEGGHSGQTNSKTKDTTCLYKCCDQTVDNINIYDLQNSNWRIIVINVREFHLFEEGTAMGW